MIYTPLYHPLHTYTHKPLGSLQSPGQPPNHTEIHKRNELETLLTIFVNSGNGIILKRVLSSVVARIMSVLAETLIFDCMPNWIAIFFLRVIFFTPCDRLFTTK